MDCEITKLPDQWKTDNQYIFSENVSIMLAVKDRILKFLNICLLKMCKHSLTLRIVRYSLYNYN